jgi:hypothetical protein
MYTLCVPPPHSLENVHGIPLGTSGVSLAYYSNIGAIGALHSNQALSNTAIKAGVIVLHGANRNADDYFCAATAAATLQTTFPTGSVAVVAPRFLEPQDGPVTLADGGTAARWNGTDENGVWRCVKKIRFLL